MKAKIKKQDDVLSDSLRHLANKMCDNPRGFSVQDGKAMDRALRSCKGISDIDCVWVRWAYVATQQEWLTVDEIEYVRGRLGYKQP